MEAYNAYYFICKKEIAVLKKWDCVLFTVWMKYLMLCTVPQYMSFSVKGHIFLSTIHQGFLLQILSTDINKLV